MSRRAVRRDGPAGPQLRGAKSAIVIEASTGQAAYKRDAGDRRQIASTTKLMTALLTLEHADLDDVFRAPSYRAGAGRVADRAEARRAHGRARPPARPAAAQRQRRGDDAGGRRRRVAQRVRARDEPRARASSVCADTHYANPIGLDAPTNYSTAADLAKLAVVLRRNDFARETMDRRRATLRTGARQRTVVNRNTLVAGVPVGQRGQDGPHELGRLRARRIGDPQRRHGRERRDRRAQRGGAGRATP